MERGAFRDRLDQLVRWGLKINWTLLRAGYCGKGFIPPQFTQEDIVAYALEKLKTVEDNLVAVLAGAENDRYEFESTLNSLAKNEGASEEIQARKLRALLVFRCMETAPDDCVEGLIHWTETWVSLGLPEDCPHIVQGRHNALSPDAYYTREMCEALKKRNADWLDQGITYIVSRERA